MTESEALEVLEAVRAWGELSGFTPDEVVEAATVWHDRFRRDMIARERRVLRHADI